MYQRHPLQTSPQPPSKVGAKSVGIAADPIDFENRVTARTGVADTARRCRRWAPYILIPASFAADELGFSAPVVFVLSALAIVALAAVIAQATEAAAEHLGTAAAGLLNATFGNATELVVSLVALSNGLPDIVKASIGGTIITNSLLAVGIAMIAGGLHRKEQRFRSEAARVNAISLNLALVVLLVPAAMDLSSPSFDAESLRSFSLVASVLLLVYYLLTLLFSMHTHRHLFELNADGPAGEAGCAQQSPPFIRSLLVLSFGSMGLLFESELLVDCLKTLLTDWHLPPLFTGLIVIPIFGGAVEYLVTANFAVKDKMDLALAVATGSSLQIAVFVAPLLVIAGRLMNRPMDLSFLPFEILAITIAVLIANSLTSSGRSNWLEGALLVVTYTVLASGVYFYR